MANVGTIDAKVGLDLSELRKNSAKAKEQFSNVKKNMINAFKVGAVAGGAALGAISVKAIQLGSDFQETNAKFNTAFRGIEKQAKQTADELAKGFNMSNLESQKLLSGTGDLLKGFGFTADEALNLSNKTQQLAADLASYNNLQGGTTRASEILTKAMLGERDALTSVGIKILETDVKQRLLEKGQQDLTGQALLAAKAQATFELALQQSGDALGDVSRTSDSFANQMRRLKANITDVTVELGQQLLPAATKVVSGLNEGFKNLDTQAIKDFAGDFLISLGDMLIGLAMFIEKNASGFDGIKENIKAVMSNIKTILSNVWNGIIKILENEKVQAAIGLIIQEFVKFQTMVTGTVAKVTEAIMKLTEGDVSGAWESIKEAVKGVYEYFSKQFGKIIDAIKEFGPNLLSNMKDTGNKLQKDISNKLAEIVIDFYNAGKKWIIELVNGIKEGKNEVANSVADIGKSIIETIKQPFKGSGTKKEFEEYGKDIADGINIGMQSGIKGLEDTATTMGGAIQVKFKEVNEIKSPSKVFEKYGANIVEGLENGIAIKTADAGQKMVELGEELKRGLDEGTEGAAGIATGTTTTGGQSNQGDENNFRGKAKQVDNTLGEIGDSFAKLGNQLEDDFLNSIGNAMNGIQSVMSNISTLQNASGLAAINPILGIASGVIGIISSFSNDKDDEYTREDSREENTRELERNTEAMQGLNNSIFNLSRSVRTDVLRARTASINPQTGVV